VVTAVTEKSKLVEYLVDDGTGAIQCTLWRAHPDGYSGGGGGGRSSSSRPPTDPASLASRGDVVTVFGKVSQLSERWGGQIKLDVE
jgi:hypothetical protein